MKRRVWYSATPGCAVGEHTSDLRGQPAEVDSLVFRVLQVVLHRLRSLGVLCV